MIRLHKDRRLFLQQNGRSPNTNLRYAECVSLKREIDGFGRNSFRSRLISSLKLPVGWLDFLRKSPCRLGCGAQERCVRPDTKKAS